MPENWNEKMYIVCNNNSTEWNIQFTIPKLTIYEVLVFSSTADLKKKKETGSTE